MTELSPEKRELAIAKARVEVAGHIVDLLTMTTYGGSKDYLARRVREVIEAEKDGDEVVLRGALMEVALASASWAAVLDLSLPYEMRTRRRRNA